MIGRMGPAFLEVLRDLLDGSDAGAASLAMSKASSWSAYKAARDSFADAVARKHANRSAA